MKRVGLALLVALWGGLMMAAALWKNQSFGSEDYSMVRAASVGALVAGWLVAPLFRKPGAAWFALATVLATTLGGSIGGALVAGAGSLQTLGAGVVVGAIFPWDLAVHSVAAAVVWGLSVIGLWMVTRRYSLK